MCTRECMPKIGIYCVHSPVVCDTQGAHNKLQTLLQILEKMLILAYMYVLVLCKRFEMYLFKYKF